MKELIEQLRMSDALTTEAALVTVAIAFFVLAAFMFWVGILAGRFILDARAGRALRRIEGSREDAWLTIDTRAAQREVEKKFPAPKSHDWGWPKLSSDPLPLLYGHDPASGLTVEIREHGSKPTKRPTLRLVK